MSIGEILISTSRSLKECIYTEDIAIKQVLSEIFLTEKLSLITF